MDFAVSQEARKWFKHIRDELELDFDIFYFCFVAGISEGRKKQLASTQTDGLVDNFPGGYRQHGKLFVALFLCRELDAYGVTMKEGSEVRHEIARLTNPNVPNYLSDDGVREFNKYAHGGFEVLMEWFDLKPRSLETFLLQFHRKIADNELSIQSI